MPCWSLFYHLFAVHRNLPPHLFSLVTLDCCHLSKVLFNISFQPSLLNYSPHPVTRDFWNELELQPNLLSLNLLLLMKGWSNAVHSTKNVLVTGHKCHQTFVSAAVWTMPVRLALANQTCASVVIERREFRRESGSYNYVGVCPLHQMHSHSSSLQAGRFQRPSKTAQLAPWRGKGSIFHM